VLCRASKAKGEATGNAMTLFAATPMILAKPRDAQ
jgi:hypothetical protein